MSRLSFGKLILRYLHAAQNPELKSIRLGLIRRNFLDEADGRYILPGGNADESSAALHIAISKLTKAGAEVLNVDMDLDKAGRY